MCIFLVWTDSISRPSLADIVTLTYHQRMQFACWYDILVLRQITLTAAVTVKIVLHYDNVQILVKEVYKSIFNEKNVILLRPLMTLASPIWGQKECGQDYIYKTFRIGQVTKWPQSSKKRVTDVDRNPSDNRNRIISQLYELIYFYNVLKWPEERIQFPFYNPGIVHEYLITCKCGRFY